MDPFACYSTFTFAFAVTVTVATVGVVSVWEAVCRLEELDQDDE